MNTVKATLKYLKNTAERTFKKLSQKKLFQMNRGNWHCFMVNLSFESLGKELKNFIVLTVWYNFLLRGIENGFSKKIEYISNWYFFKKNLITQTKN